MCLQNASSLQSLSGGGCVDTYLLMPIMISLLIVRIFWEALCFSELIHYGQSDYLIKGILCILKILILLGEYMNVTRLCFGLKFALYMTTLPLRA